MTTALYKKLFIATGLKAGVLESGSVRMKANEHFVILGSAKGFKVTLPPAKSGCVA